jgi:hypothetical protein
MIVGIVPLFGPIAPNMKINMLIKEKCNQQLLGYFMLDYFKEWHLRG